MPLVGVEHSPPQLLYGFANWRRYMAFDIFSCCFFYKADVLWITYKFQTARGETGMSRAGNVLVNDIEFDLRDALVDDP